MTETNLIRLQCGVEIPPVPEARYAEVMRGEIEPALKKLRTETTVPVKGGALHAENYVTPGAKRALIVLHGYTESAEKLREMVWYFIQAGFAVFSYDHRGHAQSLRELPDHTVVHVERFDDYVDDLEAFIAACVRPAVGDLPLCLYAHSMGGAIAAQYLVRHPEAIRRAVLTAPMILPAAGPFPVWTAYALTKTFCLAGKGRERAFIGGPYDPEKERFEDSCSTSRARFDYYTAKRNATPCLQTCAPSYQWTREAVAQSRVLLDPKRAGKVRTPVLLCQAGLDATVRAPEQERFVSLLPDAKLLRFDTARHEIYNSTDDVILPYVKAVLDFLLAD